MAASMTAVLDALRAFVSAFASNRRAFQCDRFGRAFTIHCAFIARPDQLGHIAATVWAEIPSASLQLSAAASEFSYVWCAASNCASIVWFGHQITLC